MDTKFEKKFEMMPEVAKTSGERVVPAKEDFSKSMEGMGEFKNEQFGESFKRDEYDSETTGDETNLDEKNAFDAGAADAEMLIDYGLDAAAREQGVEAVVQGLKNFDVTGTENPVEDLYVHLGIDLPEERKDMEDEERANVVRVEEFREAENMTSRSKSTEGALVAIAAMKELISEVEGADPRYESLREEARAAGMGYFEYAVKKFERRGLTDLFMVLTEQREKAEDGDEAVGDEMDDGAMNESDVVKGMEKESASGNKPGDKVVENKAVGDLERRRGARLNPEILEKAA